MKNLLFFTLLIPFSVWASDTEFSLLIHEHRFQPTEITVPAGKKVKIVIKNQDATPEEFESHTLNREKLIPGNASATVYIGPLSPGRYPFVGEFNEKTAQGVIVVK